MMIIFFYLANKLCGWELMNCSSLWIGIWWHYEGDALEGFELSHQPIRTLKPPYTDPTQIKIKTL